MSELVQVRFTGKGIASVQMNQPGAYNALSSDMLRALLKAFRTLEADPATRVVFLEGAGKGFCAGHNLKELKSLETHAERLALFQLCSTLMLTIRKFRVPVIAKVHGIASAAGCQLVASCDLAYATEDARFATPGVNIGLFCSTPMVALSRNISPKHAMEMLLTGDMVSSSHAVETGLVNAAMAKEDLDAHCNDIAQKIIAKPHRVLKVGKSAFYEQLEMSVEAAYELTANVMTENLATADAKEGISAFIEKRLPLWPDQEPDEI